MPAWTVPRGGYGPIIFLGAMVFVLAGAIQYFFGFVGVRPGMESTSQADNPESGTPPGQKPGAGRSGQSRLSAPRAGSTAVAGRDIRLASPIVTAATAPNVPVGSVSINARPWAVVLIDGYAVGTTPLANLRVTAGVHEVIWRHPQLGERRETVEIVADAPVRLSVDFRN